MNKLILAIITTTLLGSSSSYAAPNLTATTKATASLTSTCSLTASDIAFGDITSPTGQTFSTLGNLSLLCTNNTTYSIGMSLGQNTGGANRFLKGTKGQALTDTIYFICRTNDFNSTAKSCPGGMWTTSAKISGTGNGSLQNIPVYAFIVGGMFIPDSYKEEQVVVTVSY